MDKVIALAGIICGSIVAVNYLSANKKSQSKADKEQLERQQKEINELKQRVEVLESIVTDSSYQVKKEFEKL